MTARVMIAGTQSGAGKTSFTIGIQAALRRRGLRVQGFKAGPDYIDPGHHLSATGRPSYNLDAFLHGRRLALQLMAQGLADADIGVMEGFMGLFDAKEPGRSLHASSAEMARWTRTPVLLVVDAGGLSNSIAAVVRGFTGFAWDVEIKGVLLNRVGSERHYRLLQDTLQAYGLPPAIGYLRKDAAIERPERHLGLVPAPALEDRETYLDHLASAVSETVDLDAVLRLAREAPALPPASPATKPRSTRTVTVAYAYDAAFHFYYASGLRTLERLGAHLVPFSPLRDSDLPQGSQALILGGGFPELYASELSANEALATSIRAFAGPIYAECGGMMYLARSLTDAQGSTIPMLGLVPADVEMGDRLHSFGYAAGRTLVPSILGPAGTRLRGHEFHWSRLRAGEPFALELSRHGREPFREGFASGKLFASYFHIDFVAHPAAARTFLQSALQP
jgi:cobyrinic acid a,c-diamide synthase